MPSLREMEFEQDYYRDLLNKFAGHAVFRAIYGLPTPMFLGLDRRASLLGESARASRAGGLRASRNVFGGLLARSLSDAVALAEDTYRSILIAEGRIAENLRRDMLLNLLEFHVENGFGSITIPKPSDVRDIGELRNELRHLPAILRLPPEDVDARIVPLLDRLEQAAKVIPVGGSANAVLKLASDNRDMMNAIFSWTRNAPQLKKIKLIRELTAKATTLRSNLMRPTEQYLTSINDFLKDSRKQIFFNQDGYLFFKFSERPEPQPITALSSGEAQVFVILTHLFFNDTARKANVFIIDEPELSLHIQWQELFVSSLMSANPTVQYIMASHSPSIILGRVEDCVDMSPGPRTSQLRVPRRLTRGRASRTSDAR